VNKGEQAQASSGKPEQARATVKGMKQATLLHPFFCWAAIFPAGQLSSGLGGNLSGCAATFWCGSYLPGGSDTAARR